MFELKIVNKSGFDLPKKATEGAAGIDVRAAIKEPITLKPFERVGVPTGLYLEVPMGKLAEIRPRSGLAVKNGVTVENEWLQYKLSLVGKEVKTLVIDDCDGHTYYADEDPLYIINFPPTVDSDYRGEVKVLLINLSDKDYVIQSGERIGQLVIVNCEDVKTVETFNVAETTIEELTQTERADGGFSSTGKI